MKKTLLLGVAASMLSFSAMNVNAEAIPSKPSNTAKLEVLVGFVKPFEMASEKYLGFGMILADEGGKKVVVTTKGELGEGSDATMMSTASFANYYNNGSYGNVFMGAAGSFNTGLVRIKNLWGDGAGDYEVLDLVKVTLSHESVDLIAQDDSTVCGVVDAFETEVSMEGNDALIHVGGRLTTEDMRHVTSMEFCYADITVTVVFDGDVFTDIQNGNMNVN